MAPAWGVAGRAGASGRRGPGAGRVAGAGEVGFGAAAPLAVWSGSLVAHLCLGARFGLQWFPRVERRRRGGAGGGKGAGVGLETLTRLTEPVLEPLRPALDAGLLKREGLDASPLAVMAAIILLDDTLIGADGLLTRVAGLAPSATLQDLFLLEINAAKIYVLAAFLATAFRVCGVL